ncbi:MAG TPA: gluconate 2-dehydrogenase subunit 3 family protein [Caulobacteraceae bacterium]|jgi:hypothetical protein|nr:gluconate 2-dehydrogenase subunit 3 family protein [Caulobacteraceae bacterium]
MKRPYPTYDVLARWESPSFNDATRETLTERLERVPERRFFTEDEWSRLEAVVARLIPQPDRARPIPITPWIDQKLVEERGEGYRFDDLPPQAQAWRRGLAGIEAEAQKRLSKSFVDLGADDQDLILRCVELGEIDGDAWGDMSAQRFFSELLVRTVATLYYAHPVAWNEIGFGGPAGPRGYVRLGVGERDPWEAPQESVQ